MFQQGICFGETVSGGKYGKEARSFKYSNPYYYYYNGPNCNPNNIAYKSNNQTSCVNRRTAMSVADGKEVAGNYDVLRWSSAGVWHDVAQSPTSKCENASYIVAKLYFLTNIISQCFVAVVPTAFPTTLTRASGWLHQNTYLTRAHDSNNVIFSEGLATGECFIHYQPVGGLAYAKLYSVMFDCDAGETEHFCHAIV